MHAFTGCNTIIFKSLNVRCSFSLMAVYLHRIWVKFTYEGHWVKVKVTGAERSKIAISAT